MLDDLEKSPVLTTLGLLCQNFKLIRLKLREKYKFKVPLKIQYIWA